MARQPGFHAFADQVFAAHERGDFQEGLQAVRAAADRFPDRAESLAYWEACFLARLGRPDEALATLRHALVRGLWWDPAMLERDPDLDPVRRLPAFGQVVAECERRLAEARAETTADLRIIELERTERAPPLVIALHWRGRSSDDFAEQFEPVVRLGAVLALPRSSQRIGPDAFAWDDRETAERELRAAFDTITRTVRFDPVQIILAGASQGGSLAISLALRGDLIPARGFLAVVPAVGKVDGFQHLLEPAARRGVRGWLLTGERDPGRANIERFHERCRAAGLPCHLTVVPGLEHDFPLDFADRLPAALAYLGTGPPPA